MTEDVSAGRLVAEVVSDTTGFARDAKKKIDAEVRAIKARIKVEIDTRGLATQAKAAAKEASKAAVVRLKVQLDTKGLIGQARAAAAAASAAAVVRVRTEIDTSDVVAKVKAAAAEASRAKATVGVGADTAEATADIDALKAKAKASGVDIPVRADSKGLKQASTALKQLSVAPAIAGGIYTLGVAIVQLGGGLLAVVSAGSQALGVLGAIPNLIGVAAQGAGSLVIGLNGVGEALGLMGKAESATTAATAAGSTTAQATARAVESAARQRVRALQNVQDAQLALKDAETNAKEQSVNGARAIAGAQQALADARVAAADRSRAAIESVSDAEWSLARAQENSADAQKYLDQARVAAKKHIDDLNAALKSGAIDEEAAMLAVEKARQHLQDVNWNAASSDLDKKEAENQVKQAEDNAARIQSANKDLAKDAAKANKDGVEGSDQVKNARDQLRDALHAEQEDTENLANAQRDLQRAGVESARAIAAAQQGVADAIKANKDGQVAAARAIVQAQRGVVQAQQSYTDAVRAVGDANKDAAAGSSQAARAQTLLAAAMAKLSPAGQKFAKFIFSLKPQWMGLRNAVQQALLPPIQEGVTAALPLLGTLQDGLVDSATVAGGLGKELGEALGEKTFQTDVASIMDSNNRALGSFGDTGLNVIQILRHLAVAAEPLTERFAAWTATLTGTWAEEIKTARESGKLEGWLNKAGDTAALLGDILGNVVGSLFNMGKAAAPAGEDLLKTLDKTTQKWQTFTQSDAGQAKMKEFFDATKPATEELGRLVSNLVVFITKAGEGGGGSLNGFLKTLNLLLGGLNKIMEIPGAAPFLGWLLTLAGVGGALGLVASAVLRVGANLGKLGKITGVSKLVQSLRGADEAASATSGTMAGKLTSAVKTAASATVTGAKAFGAWIVGAARAGAAAVATAVRVIALRVATVAMAVASGIARAATIAWTAVQWLLNAAFFASPIGLIVLAVGLLIAAFIYAWKHSETFRKIVTAALNGLKTAALAVFNALSAAVRFVINFVTNHWKLLLGIIGGPLVAVAILIATHWHAIISTITAAIGAIVGFLVGFGKRVLQVLTLPFYIANALISAALNALGALFTAIANWVVGTWKKGWAKVSGVLSGPIDAARRAIGGKIQEIKDAFTSVKNWIVDTWSKAWGRIKAKITGPIDDAKAAITHALGPDGLRKTFSDAVSAVGKIWDGLQDLAKKPIKFIVNTVLNDGLIGGFNWIAGKVGAPAMDPIKLPQGFEAGGQYSGQIPGRPSKKDNLVARGPLGQRIGLATGEFIVKASETMKNLPLLRAINSGKISGRVSQMLQGGFADGGLFGKVKNAIGGAARKGKEFGGDVLDVLRDPAGWFKKRMSGPLDRMKELGDSQFVDTIKRVPRKIVDTVVGKAKSILTGLGGSGGGTGPINPGLDGALKWVRTQVGKPYLWGGVGPDGYDCSGLMGALVNVIKGVEDPFTRLFATGSMPAGIFEKGRGAFQVAWFRGNPGHTAGTLNGVNVESRGGKGVVVGPNARGADDPLFNSGVYHLPGYAGGGQVGDAPFDSLDPRGKNRIPNVDELMRSLGVTFDTGGWLNTGHTVVDNGTGDHEAILNPASWRGASSVLDQIHALANQIRTTDSTRAAGTAPVVGSLQVTVGDKNDLPEALDEVTHHLRVIRRGGVYAGDPD